MKDIRPELDAIADSAEGRRAFEHAYRLPLARERERGGQPAKPATDDEDRVLQDQTALVFSCSQRRLNGLLHVARRHGSMACPFHARKRGWKSEPNAEFHRSPRCPGSSCPGLTRASMLPNKALLRRRMDCRVRPGNDAMAPMRPVSELHADAAIERIGPAAPQRDGEADEAPQQRVLVTAVEPGKSSLPIEHRDDEHFHRGGGGEEAREQADDERDAT